MDTCSTVQRTLLQNPGVTAVVWHGKVCLYVGHREVARHFRELKWAIQNLLDTYYISLLRNSLLVEQQNQKFENLFLRPPSEKEHQISSFNLRWLLSYDTIHGSQGWNGACEMETLSLVALKQAQLFIKRGSFKLGLKQWCIGFAKKKHFMDSWMIGRLINLVSVGSGLSQSQMGGFMRQTVSWLRPVTSQSLHWLPHNDGMTPESHLPRNSSAPNSLSKCCFYFFHN